VQDLLAKNPMTQLYSRLGGVGFPRKYLRKIVLPSWWDDEIAHNPAGYTEGLMLLSRNLGLDLARSLSENYFLINQLVSNFSKMCRNSDLQ
jgi:hypothetical protein